MSVHIPAGLSFLESMIRLVDNKSEIKKVLASINKARDEANAAIRVFGTVKEIEKLKTNAEAALKKATNMLADAKKKAEIILGKAGEGAASEKERQQRADDILDAANARANRLEKREKTVGAREHELQAQMDQVAVLRTEADSLKVQADNLAAKANEQMDAFKRFAATVN